MTSPGDGGPDLRKPVLEVENLSKYFAVGSGLRAKRLRALNEITFNLYPREVVALVGESGSGKSTIARILIRLLPASGGRISFKGQDILRAEPRRASLAYRSRVQMIFQDPFGSLNPVHTIGYHLERPMLRHGKISGAAELKQKVHELLDTVGLSPAAEFAGKYPYQASGGQRQRVAIARAVAVDPEVILADEPISMLDVSIRMGILNLMQRLKEERNLSYLYITHDLASARYFADRTLVLYAGHMVEGAPSEELMQEPAHPYTQLLLSAVPDPQSSIRSALSAKSGAPQLVDPPPGCPFAARCPKVMDICREQMPPAVDVAPQHWVRCHLYPSAAAANSARGTSDAAAPS
jgi:peptide/nickel transport system ATP-binding protein